MAIRNTVSDFSEPIRPPLKRPFSETHIARNICAQKLSTVAENNDSTSTIAPTELESGSEDMRLDDYTYKPTSPDAAKGFNAMLKLVAKILSEAADEHTATADDLVIEGASNSIIFYMKDETLSNEAKLAEVNEILDADVSNIQLAKLQNYADRLDDYAPPLDQTDASGSTTLNSRRTSSPVPQNYPDPEAITETTLTAHTFTGLHSPPLDLLVRTSGVERLSDFMLWQCHQDTDVAFLKCLWPEFSLWHFLPVILEWQWKRRKEKVWTESHGHAKRD
jgi:ditrans,polycis-polyprenyl diphosphate synthase